MKNFFLMTIVPMLISTVSSAAESIACTPATGSNAVVVLMHKINGMPSFRVTIAEGFAPEYVDDQQVNLTSNQNSDVLSVKTKKNEIKISLSKGFLNTTASDKINESVGAIEISQGKVKMSEKIDCFIYE